MKLSFLSPHRTVMVITDEAAYIYATSTRGVRLVEAVPWEVENFAKNVAGILSKDCGNKPVLILNDMVEQHYRKEKLIKGGVGVLDRASVLKRKLNVAFPNYPVKAALALKEKMSKGEGKLAADIYIFAAVPETKQFTSTISAVNLSLVPVAGFCLLPVESADMVKTLSEKLIKKGEPKYRWVLFMGQHRDGGLRQIVTKNGDLALTRMTPVSESDNDVEAWASEFHQEFKATMSYLSRFGFQPEDGLHVIVMANSAAGAAIESKIDDPCKYTALTSAEAARELDMPFGPQEDPRYADPLHAGWVGRKQKFILPMKAQQVEQVSRPRQIAMAATVLMVLSIAFLGYQLLNELGAIKEVYGDIDEVNGRRSQLNVQYQKEVERKEKLGFDVRLVQSSIAVYDGLEDSNIEPLSFFDKIGRAMGKDLRLSKIVIKKPISITIVGLMNSTEIVQPDSLFETNLQMTYPSTTDVDKGNKEVADLKDRLQSFLPDCKVEVSKFLKDYEYVEEITVETGDTKKAQDVSQDFVAEILIKGPPLKTAEVVQ